MTDDIIKLLDKAEMHIIQARVATHECYALLNKLKKHAINVKGLVNCRNCGDLFKKLDLDENKFCSNCRGGEK